MTTDKEVIEILFKKDLVPAIRAGTKVCTIRDELRCGPGDLLSLRYWGGEPEGTEQVEAALVRCDFVCPFSIPNKPSISWFLLDDQQMTRPQMDLLAVHDGFADAVQMLDWFKANYGVPFKGFLIRWIRVEQGKAAA